MPIVEDVKRHPEVDSEQTLQIELKIPYQVGNIHGFGEVFALGIVHSRGHNFRVGSCFHETLKHRTHHENFGPLR